MKKKVAIIMGSKTDFAIMNEASLTLKELGVGSHVQIVSAHRTPEKMVSFAKAARSKGYQVIIAGAGGAAHLPGMVASLTTLPVIGVPIQIGGLNGLDALLSIAQMPKGIPVATVAVNNAVNAGLLAARILSLHDDKLTADLLNYQKSQRTKVTEMNKEIRTLAQSKKVARPSLKKRKPL